MNNTKPLPIQIERNLSGYISISDVARASRDFVKNHPDKAKKLEDALDKLSKQK